MNNSTTTASQGLTSEQQDLWERFQAAYNSIDHHMRHRMRMDRASGFSSVLRTFEETQRLGSDGDFLRMIGDLRNVLIHTNTASFLQLAVPTRSVVERIESINQRITNPPGIFPKFKKEVECLGIEDSLATALKKIQANDFSQFPVYSDGDFRGLLTENGITRWLAKHITNELSLIDLDDVPVEQILSVEEARPNFKFVARNKTVGEVRTLFQDQGFLEVVLITEKGRSNEKLLGLVSLWDVLAES